MSEQEQHLAAQPTSALSPADAEQSARLDDVEELIRLYPNIEKWRRDALLADVRSLSNFYRAHH
jgi:hypothetical protein